MCLFSDGQVRKELKRLKQELHVARHACYVEQQRAEVLQTEMDLSTTQVNELKRRLVHRRTSICLGNSYSPAFTGFPATLEIRKTLEMGSR